MTKTKDKKKKNLDEVFAKRAKHGEVVGAGFVIHARCRKTGRLRSHGYPFEQASLAAAEKERQRLEAKDGEHSTFEIYAKV